MLTKKEQRLRRARQTRIRIAQQGIARLTVNRTNLHIYATVISEDGSKVLAAASTAQADVRKSLGASGKGGNTAAAQGAKLNLQVGYSHPVNLDVPKGLEVKTPTPTEIVVTGFDKQVLGQFAAEIRAIRPPEPYKGKGIRYADEKITIKETKKK